MQAVSRSFREEHKIDVANVGHGCVIISEGGVNIFSHETNDQAFHLSITNAGRESIRHGVFARSPQGHKHVLLTKFGYRFSVGISSGGTAIVHGMMCVSKDTIERQGDINVPTYWSMFVPAYFVSGDILNHYDDEVESLDPFTDQEFCKILDSVEHSERVMWTEIHNLRKEIAELRGLTNPPRTSGNPFE